MQLRTILLQILMMYRTVDGRFAEAAELLAVCWLEIRGKMHSQMLSGNTKYAAYMVFKMDDVHHGLDSPLQDAVVSIGENRSTGKVCLRIWQ
jgi:hypothetical protein